MDKYLWINDLSNKFVYDTEMPQTTKITSYEIPKRSHVFKKGSAQQ